MQLKERLLATVNSYHPIRPPQTQMVEFLAQEMAGSNRIICVNGPVGTGKSVVALALQKHVRRTMIIAPDNSLVEQYKETEPKINTLKGRSHYVCESGASDCGSTFEGCGEYCGKCPYLSAKIAADMGEPTVANPMSYLVGCWSGSITPAETLIIDEAHGLAGFLRDSFTLRLELEGKVKEPQTAMEAAEIIRKQKGQVELQVTLAKARNQEAVKEMKLLGKLKTILTGLEFEPHSWLFYLDSEAKKRTLVIESMYVPNSIKRVFLQSRKIVLMSGTLYPHHVSDLVGEEPYSFCTLPSIIPKENRPVRVQACAVTVNKDTHPAMFVKEIVKIVERHPNKRGIIHATYGLADKLKPLLEGLDLGIRGHGKTDKKEKLEEFKAGKFPWLLASGMAEGIDLPGDLARINILCRVHYPNLGNPYVKKRLLTKGGRLWYASSALQHIVQAAGRTTRGPTDESVTYILDPGINKVLKDIKSLAGQKHNEYIPPYFMEAFYAN
jgi:Rad3-related DNA helicase